MLNIGSCYYCSHSPDQWKGFYGYRDIKGIWDTFMKIQNIFMDMVIQSLGISFYFSRYLKGYGIPENPPFRTSPIQFNYFT